MMKKLFILPVLALMFSCSQETENNEKDKYILNTETGALYMDINTGNSDSKTSIIVKVGTVDLGNDDNLSKFVLVDTPPNYRIH